MRKNLGKKLLAICLSVFMAAGTMPVGSFAAEQTSQTSASYEMQEDGSGKNITEQATEMAQSESEEIAYDMYKDGSGKNIEPSEQQEESDDSVIQGGQDSIQSYKKHTIGKAGLQLIKEFESCKLTAYKAVSSEKYWTIGWGHYGADVTQGMTITQAKADQLLKEDMAEFEAYVNSFAQRYNISLTQNQFDALVSFSYNVGTRWMSSSTIGSYLKNGISNYTSTQIRTAFCMWNRAGGVVLAGLTRRRNAETDLFLKKTTLTSDTTSTLPAISGYNTPPNTLTLGKSFTLVGTITSKTSLTKVTAGIYNTSGKQLMTGKTVYPNVKTYSLSKLDDYIVFGKLKAGTYRYIVTATNAKGTKQLINKKFKVTHTHSYTTTTTKATSSANGKIVKKCSVCGSSTTTVIYAPKKVTLSTTSYTYDGKVKTPSVTVKDANGKTVSSSYYTVTYASGRKNIGTYKVTLKFVGSKYAGTIAKTFSIKPSKVTLKSVASKAAGKVTVSWAKKSNITAYQIQYSKRANFPSSKSKTVTVKGSQTVQKTLSNLTKGKKYYVRIRCYKKLNGKTYISEYSSAKTVMIKK